MDTKIINDIPKYNYKLTNGISSIKGGVSVLKQLIESTCVYSYKSGLGILWRYLVAALRLYQ